MSSVFIVNNTDGTLNLSMPPGSLNGPGSGTRDSDLRLYGMGTLLWGEGVNENILRIAENWACDEKAGFPGIPQDESDIAPGLGITTPLIGQTWFNKTDEQLYVYNGTLWLKTSAVLVATSTPGDPEPGDLWFDISGGGNPCSGNQLRIWDGSTWISIAQDYLAGCGGTVTGDIDMTSNSILNLIMPAGTDPLDAANRGYVDDAIELITGPTGALTLHANDNAIHVTSNQNILLDELESVGCANGVAAAALVAADICALKGYTTSSGTVYTNVNGKLSKSGGTMTGDLTLSGPGHFNTPGLAATQDYVDDQISTVTNIGTAVRLVRYFTNDALPGGSPNQVDGDIFTSGSTIKMWAAGAWRQIYPALYT